MAADITRNVDNEFDDWTCRVFEARVNLLKQMICDGVHIVSGAALATYTWRMNFHPIYPFVCSTIGAAGVVGLFINLRNYLRRSPNILTEGSGSKWYLATGTITYLSNVYAFKEALKRNCAVWKACFVVAAFGYCLAASSMDSFLGRDVLNRKPQLKCCQLMFGPALIASASYYLLRCRQHDEKLLLFLTWMPFVLQGNNISYTGCRRFERSDEPHWQLFKASELFFGGFILSVAGALLAVYSIKNGYQLINVIFSIILLGGGISDIQASIDEFQKYADMEDPVFNSICCMIAGPVIFTLSCIGVKYLQHPAMLPSFFIVAGMGITLLWDSIIELRNRLQPMIFHRYIRRVMGPVLTVWGFLVTAYVGYYVGWRYSPVGTPLIFFGLLEVYRGYSNTA